MTNDRPEPIFSNAARRQQAADNLVRIWDTESPQEVRAKAADQLVSAAETRALSAPEAAQVLYQVWHWMGDEGAKKTAD